jgi:hypothetical protein
MLKVEVISRRLHPGAGPTHVMVCHAAKARQGSGKKLIVWSAIALYLPTVLS